MTNGQPLRVRAAMKPISTVPRALATVDMATGEEAVAIHQRSDVCAVPAAGVVVETMVALVLARAALEKFGGDSLAETRAQRGRLPARGRPSASRRTRYRRAGVGLMAPKAVLVGHARLGQVHHRAASGQGARTCRCSTPTPRSSRPPAAPSPTSSLDGEPEFRRIEAEVVRAALADTRRGRVAGRRRGHLRRGARGAGRPHRDLPGNQCGRGCSAHLRRPARPLLAGADPAEKFRALMTQRVPLYREVATMRINTNRRNPGAVVRHIVHRLHCATTEPERGRRRRRPAWRRLPTVLNPAPTTEAPAESRGAGPPSGSTQ